LRNFIKIADSAGKIGFSSENSEIKSILEKSGSNRTLKDKKISMDLLAPFSYINNHKGSGAMEKYRADANKKETPPIWKGFQCGGAHWNRTSDTRIFSTSPSPHFKAKGYKIKQNSAKSSKSAHQCAEKVYTVSF
jgi:hypothetical protein